MQDGSMGAGQLEHFEADELSVLVPSGWSVDREVLEDWSEHFLETRGPGYTMVRHPIALKTMSGSAGGWFHISVSGQMSAYEQLCQMLVAMPPGTLKKARNVWVGNPRIPAVALDEGDAPYIHGELIPITYQSRFFERNGWFYLINTGMNQEHDDREGVAKQIIEILHSFQMKSERLPQ